MAIDGNSVGLPVTLPVHGSQAPLPAQQKTQPPGGNVLPQSGNSALSAAVTAAPNSHNPAQKPAPSGAVVAQPAAPAAQPPRDAKPAAKPDPGKVAAALNKALNDSGRPDQFRLASASGEPVIEQINPATGAVIGQYSAAEFPALAASAEAGGSLVDSTA
jgi:hypothetical protein